MQEEVTQKTVTFCIRTTKVTADLLKKVLAAYLRHQKQKSVEKKAKKNQPKQGKIIDYGVKRIVYISCKPTSLARRSVFSSVQQVISWQRNMNRTTVLL